MTGVSIEATPTPEKGQRSRLDIAREVAGQLLDELEGGAAPISQSLMRAMRLARLLRDDDAHAWLTLETNGYPSDFDLSSLGSCQRYPVEGGRVTSDGKYYLPSLPKIEAELRAAEASLPKATSGPPLKVDDYIQAGATAQVLRSVEQQAEVIRARYTQWSALIASMRASIHAYAADTSLALELGDVAEDIFESARRDVDLFVRSHAPNAVQQLVAISERMRETDEESLTAGLASCRRLLAAMADAIFPPLTEEYVDGAGNRRKAGAEEYKNRLLAFIERSIGSDSTRSILSADLHHLAARLDAVYEKACKGVHANVTIAEARLAVIGTYLFLAEVARVAPPPSTKEKAETEKAVDPADSQADEA